MKIKGGDGRSTRRDLENVEPESVKHG